MIHPCRKRMVDALLVGAYLLMGFVLVQVFVPATKAADCASQCLGIQCMKYINPDGTAEQCYRFVFNNSNLPTGTARNVWTDSSLAGGTPTVDPSGLFVQPQKITSCGNTCAHNGDVNEATSCMGTAGTKEPAESLKYCKTGS